MLWGADENLKNFFVLIYSFPMKYSINKTFLFVLSIACVLLISTRIFAGSLITEQINKEQSPVPLKAKTATAPDIAEIIPLASDLHGRFVQLKSKIEGLSDIADVEKKFSQYQDRTEGLGTQLTKIKDAEGENRFRLINLSRILKDEKTYFEFVNRPLGRNISRVAAWKTDWVTEKKRWNNWEKIFLADHQPEQLRSAFAEAQATIDKAIHIVQQQLEAMLQIQAKGAAVKSRIEFLEAKSLALISASRTDSLLAAAPPMFSLKYFSQFRRELWQKAVTNMKMITLPDSRFFVRYGKALVGQMFLFFVVVFIIYRNRKVLLDSKHWQFIADRPVASGIFVCILTLQLFPQSQIFPIFFRLVSLVAGGISFILLVERMLERSWKRQVAFGVIFLFVVTGTITAVNLPLPLFRLFTFSASIAGLYFFWRWSRDCIENNEFFMYPWLLRLGAVLAGIIIVAQLWGMDRVAAYLFGATVSTLAIALAYILFMYMIYGVLNWIFYFSPVWNVKQLRSESETLIDRIGFIIYTCIVVFALLPMILSAWGLFGTVQDAITGFLTLGFDVGSQRISIGLILAAIATLYVSHLLSWVFPKIILDEKLAGVGLERGVRISIGRLIQYLIIFIGFILTFMVLGLDLTKITIILSALGVGIGFGLQGIVNNFISGLILLFERPIRIGDIIEMTDIWAEIKRIGLRSTTVRTFDESEVIIPNADLVSNLVTNWTLNNRQARLKIPVGVAYGSDIPLVIETLLDCAKQSDQIVKSPGPQVLFRNFGESSLEFELRVWIKDVDNRFTLSSELRQMIDQKFREANIEIAFPQRDLHLRSIDAPIIVKSGDAD